MADTDTTKPAAASAEAEPTSSPPDMGNPTDATAENATDADDKQDKVDANGEKADAEDAADAADGKATANGLAKKKDAKRRLSGVPEHKSKKLNKKKSTANLNLKVQPGELYYARMKGHPPWPSIVCDEEMLPETLLGKRPVSAANPDGKFRADFQDGGKNVKDRRYPIMFLGTNEFGWLPNTELTPIDLDEIKELVDKNEQGKKSKLLWDAYKTAAEGYDLNYYKNMLSEFEDAARKAEQQKAQKDAEKAAKKEKAAKRKSKTAADADADADANGDIEMTDAADEEAAEKKPSKKRKKAADSEGEAEKPAKTPKTKLKVKGPKETPEESASKPKKATKAKKPVAAKPVKAPSSDEEAEPMAPVEPEYTDEEKRLQKEKAVLFLRHKLQKGFISRDNPPAEEDMKFMSENLSQLEMHSDLEAQVIKTTKINKVLKAILKIAIIPRDAEFNFKERCTKLLNDYNQKLGDNLTTPTSGQPAVNGVKHEGGDKGEKSDPPADASEPQKTAVDEADVSMADAKDDAPSKTEAAADKIEDEADKDAEATTTA